MAGLPQFRARSIIVRLNYNTFDPVGGRMFIAKVYSPISDPVGGRMWGGFPYGGTFSSPVFNSEFR